MKSEEENDARKFMRRIASPVLIELIGLKPRDRLLMHMIWSKGKSYETTAKHFSLKRERVRQICGKSLQRLIVKFSHMNDKNEELERLEKKHNALKAELATYHSRFEALKRRDEIPEESKEITKEDFGDLKVLKTPVTELGLSDTITWKLIYHNIPTVGILLDTRISKLKEEGIMLRYIKEIQEALAKRNLKLKE